MEKGPGGRGPPDGTEVRKDVGPASLPFRVPQVHFGTWKSRMVASQIFHLGLYVGMNPEFGKALALLESE